MSTLGKRLIVADFSFEAAFRPTENFSYLVVAGVGLKFDVSWLDIIGSVDHAAMSEAANSDPQINARDVFCIDLIAKNLPAMERLALIDRAELRQIQDGVPQDPVGRHSALLH